MTSHLYAIADAGSNIYPGTFHKTAHDSQWAHVIGRNHGTWPIDYIEQVWPDYIAKGDHVVYCRIETNETVVVTQEAP